MKVFADTNFLISAFATRGLSSEVFELVVGYHKLVLSEHVITELQDKFSRKLKIPNNRIKEIEDFLRKFQVIDATKKTQYEIQDEDDKWILAAAIESGSDVLITGDKDLLEINSEVLEIEIITPRQFWEKLKSQ